MKIADLQAGDCLVNAYGETVMLIVEKTPDEYAYVTLFGPPHYALGKVFRETCNTHVELGKIFDVYREGRFYLNAAASERAAAWPSSSSYDAIGLPKWTGRRRK